MKVNKSLVVLPPCCSRHWGTVVHFIHGQNNQPHSRHSWLDMPYMVRIISHTHRQSWLDMPYMVRIISHTHRQSWLDVPWSCVQLCCSVVVTFPEK